ncbi:MFS transporter [Mycobacterium sp. MS1601]|uniref:MFS transporter n=1 Tax=Mycobacterium sp. MS1601 TaxID=1936029 RepID=UPI0009790D50|nr:MFS transporter [Mycobacterium sp. MS1601]AQA05044.1 MFS transporter [Mycobacterium sp. MS1601]
MGPDRRFRILLASVCAVAVATVYAAQPILPEIGAELGLPQDRLGMVVAAGQLGYLIGLAALVPLGDLFDRRRLIAAHLALAATAVSLAATAGTAWLLVTALAAAGVFSAVVQTTVAYAAALASPSERGRTIGVVTAGVVIGILGGRVAAGALTSTVGWRGVYAALAAGMITLTFVVLRLLPPDPRPVRSTYCQTLASLGRLFGDRVFLIRGAIGFLLFASFSTLWSGLALPLTSAPWQLSAAQIGLFGLIGLAGAVGAARAGRWADTGLVRLVTGGALTLLVLSWGAIGQAPTSLWLLVVGVVLLDFAVQAVHVSNQHVLTTAHPERTSSVIGGYMIFYALGSAAGATATTAVYTAHGWAGSSLLGGALALAAVTVWAVDWLRPATCDQ